MSYSETDWVEWQIDQELELLKNKIKSKQKETVKVKKQNVSNNKIGTLSIRR